MLDVANKYENELQELFMSTWHNPKYKFYTPRNWRDTYKTSNGTWSGHEFVSIDSKNNIIGYIDYEIVRTTDSILNLSIINFTDYSITFARDVEQALRDIFFKFNFRKLSTSVVVGNPIEKTYDKLYKKYGGRIVGIFKEDCKLMDGKYYDMKHYEIFAEDLKIKNI